MQGDSPRRKPIRMPGYDYAQVGTYVFTAVVQGHRCCLGAVEDHECRLAPAGEIVREVWERLPRRFPTILMDAFVVMPNHIHGIVILGGKPVIGDDYAINGDATQDVHLVAPPFMASRYPKTLPPLGQSRALKPPSRDPMAPALGEIVRSLKAASTTRIRKECFPDFEWQERYWDRIVRNEAELERFRSYIVTNPERWTLDREYAGE